MWSVPFIVRPNQGVFSFPAAKTNHHAFESGLAYHTATMIRLADSIGDIYPRAK